jgi:2-polyprenyl-3-methyl-5-hydroxy-6-metoxy-1,4-benzoquinol methylase
MAINRSLVDLSTKPDQYFSQSRPEMERFVPATTKRILDVGCGEGSFSFRLKERLGAEVWGVELVPAIADVARSRLDRILCGDVMQQLELIPDHYFDCAIFNDVIEHLVDPYRMLIAVKQKLTRGGVVVCSIPNIRYFRNLFDIVIRGQFRYQEGGILDKTHLRFFTKKSIIEMFESLGYRILSVEGINATPSWRVGLFNIATLGYFSDTRYVQFGVVAEPLLTDAAGGNYQGQQ